MIGECTIHIRHLFVGFSNAAANERTHNFSCNLSARDYYDFSATFFLGTDRLISEGVGVVGLGKYQTNFCTWKLQALWYIPWNPFKQMKKLHAEYDIKKQLLAWSKGENKIHAQQNWPVPLPPPLKNKMAPAILTWISLLNDGKTNINTWKSRR